MRRLGLCALLTFALAPATAFAYTKPTLALSIDACVEVDYSEVGRLVAVELKSAIVTAASPETVQVGVTCLRRFVQVRVEDPSTSAPIVESVAPRPLLELRVDDPISGKSLWRRINLNRVDPAAKARLLAIAIAELVSASWLEIEANPEPRVPPVDAVRSAAPRIAVSQALADASATVSLTAGALAFAKGDPPTWGGGLTVTKSFASGLGIEGGARFHYGRYSRLDGHVCADVSAAQGVFFLHTAVDRAQLAAGVGMRVGVAHLAGSSAGAAAEAVRGFWGGPLLALRARYRLSLSWAIIAAVDGGYSVWPVRGVVDPGPDVVLAGLWYEPQLGVAWSW